LQQICCTFELAERRFGTMHAQELISLIADVEALDKAEELINFFDGRLRIAEDDQICLQLGTNYQMTFYTVGKKFTKNEQGRVVWSSVTRLKLLDIREVQ
jgi:hypothetical protein